MHEIPLLFCRFDRRLHSLRKHSCCPGDQTADHGYGIRPGWEIDHRVIIWNANTGKKVRTLNGHSRGVVGLCLLSDQNRLVSTGIDQSLRVWDLETGELARSMSIHTMRVNLTSKPLDVE